MDDANPTGYSQVLEVRSATSESGIASATPDTYVLGMDVVGQWKASPTTSVLDYYLYDGHMSVRGLVDGAGAVDVTQVYDYDGFGNAKGLTPDTAKSALLYVGEWWDVPVAGYDNRARIYLPGIGRLRQQIARRDGLERVAADNQGHGVIR
jgi:hypothetical protein